jgi:hypothetical protein
MGMYDYKFLLGEAQALGLAADEYSTNEVDFEITNPNIGRSGNFGMHVVVTTTFAGAASGIIWWIVDGAATSPTTKTVGRFTATASLVAGYHFYVPGPQTILRYARWLHDLVSEVTTAGAVTWWFGPLTGGEL